MPIRQKNCLVISSRYPPYANGGYEMGACAVVTGMKAEGWNPIVAVGGKRWVGHVDGRGCFYLGTRRNSLRQMILMQRNCGLLRSKIRKHAFDCILVFQLAGLGDSLGRVIQQCKLPIFLYASDLSFKNTCLGSFGDWLRYATRHSLLRKRLGLMMGNDSRKPRSLNWNRVFTCSEYIRREYEDFFEVKHPVTVLPWGVATGNRPLSERISKRHELLLVGRLVPEKGVKDAIRVLAGLRRQGFGELKLKVIGHWGSGEFEQDCLILAEQLGVADAINWLGPMEKEKIREYYEKTACLLFPVIWDEPFAFVPLEAAAAGCPIVASRTGGTPEFVIDGETGLLFEAGNIEQAVAAVKLVLDSDELAKRLAANARKRVVERHDKGIMVAKMLEFIQADIAQSKEEMS